MKLGIFGGTFDPVHYGHLLLAECCRGQCGLGQVWFMPAEVPPHKQEVGITSGVRRAEMLELAIAGHASFAVSRRELVRGGVSYTVDTLEELHAEDPTRELFFVLGADSLIDLPNWKSPARICELATLMVAGRSVLAELDDRPLRAALGAEAAGHLRVARIVMPQVELSSREIRRRVAAGESIRYRTPRAVEKYIETAGLYLPNVK
jgi:nicotinate-nucleotide adenylyltransferase